MGYPIDLMERPTDDVLEISVSTPAAEIGAAIGAAIAQLFTQAERTGLQPCGPPEATYVGRFPLGSTAPTEILVDLPVTGPLQSADGVRHRKACQVARTVYRGPYDGIGEAHQAVAAWANSKGYRFNGPLTEVYLVGPDRTRAPSAYLTEIQVPVSR